MKKFGVRDTRFFGMQEAPEHPEQDHTAENAEQVHFHNWFNEIFHGKTFLSKLSGNCSRKPM